VPNFNADAEISTIEWIQDKEILAVGTLKSSIYIVSSEKGDVI